MIFFFFFSGVYSNFLKLTDEKFAEKAQNFMLWKSIEGKYYTSVEYIDKVRDIQTDKDGFTILLYVDDVVGKDSFVEAAKAKGYDILEFNGQLDSH